MDNPNSSREQRTLTIVVKTPNQAHPDQIIEGVDINWTVKDLKTHLFRVYPDNPLEKDQRIIYSGKLLPDHLPIRDAFRKSDMMPTVHLVCAVRAQPLGQLGARPKVPTAEPQRVAPSPLLTGENTVAPTAPQAPITGPPAEGLRHRGHPTPASPPWASPAVPGTAPMTQPTFPTYSLYSPQQLLWLQQMYVRQYYMHYQAALAAAASSPVAPVPAAATAPTAHPAALPNQAPIDNLPPNQNPANPEFINPGGANQNMRMNAQGGPVMEDEEDAERDWLDWVYTASRFAVFLSIVYFYSTISRFILVMSSLLIMYLHTAGWFPFRRRPMVPAPNEPAPEVIQNHQNQNRNAGPEGVPPGGADADGNADAATEGGAGQDEVNPLPAVLVPPHRVSLVWTAWVFFKAFFASLIPDAPQVMAN
ncbi:hypothetical protein AGOR_G00168830 [Albula goreensis]|uniref:Ubiquitin-like domain-containing protein n=1 Tax=Albula goreensis TaxID=1534307 RepID=A0A8T3CXG0_9TELE|nr:hypothetical protein AGOR_G00168830 [Albula goreensis]